MKFTFVITSIAAALTVTSAANACSPVWGQCGGVSWTGPTCCQTGSTCVSQENNIYYSQCLPASSNNHNTATTKKAKTSTTTTTTKMASTTTMKIKTTTTSKTTTTTTTTTEAATATNGYSVMPGGQSGSGTTTRYWDCCKSSCSWPGKASVSAPVDVCAANGISILDSNAVSGCNGGNGFMCNNNQPWAVNEHLSYGFAAASVAGSNEAGWCCSCYELTFTSGPVSGKKMVVQVTNTGGDLGSNHFDLQIPGGGVGYFNGCSAQWGAPQDGWGARYGGLSSASDCASLPSQLQAGCEWRFKWFKNADNPSMTFKQVTCPAELTIRTGCERK
ncbi:RlpA-like double-psi beta-barrel-protein domain-containing protein-containing protein [Cokeromyces recurvatus]|uniref:RlpA-like double-psi beta-barrel-protein domain-containing protein-containing protein n=1 Tax=Cokeromyces recurvatus TaxID=90255 RepID=UPI00221F2B39|nr:RlpA-like double-psi beta-barrel-protein domain-containing protein-containing protein [Cokeromyces recurvatus]KAI7905747.1 RlpA-like double-psi beta-barrel-protein domain-containing protein-containing protein [Cokeromyces recurvatus]